jgi:hypothetical protein
MKLHAIQTDEASVTPEAAPIAAPVPQAQAEAQPAPAPVAAPVAPPIDLAPILAAIKAGQADPAPILEALDLSAARLGAEVKESRETIADAIAAQGKTLAAAIASAERRSAEAISAARGGGTALADVGRTAAHMGLGAVLAVALLAGGTYAATSYAPPHWVAEVVAPLGLTPSSATNFPNAARWRQFAQSNGHLLDGCTAEELAKARAQVPSERRAWCTKFVWAR